MKKIVLLCLFSFGLVIAGGGENPPTVSSTALRKRTKSKGIRQKQKKEVQSQINLYNDEPAFLASILNWSYWVQTSMCGGIIPDRENED